MCTRPYSMPMTVSTPQSVCLRLSVYICLYTQHPCNVTEEGVSGSCLEWKGSSYSDASAVFVLIAAIIVFFMVRVSCTSHE